MDHLVAAFQRDTWRGRVLVWGGAGLVMLAVMAVGIPAVAARFTAASNTGWMTVQRGSYQGHAWQLEVSEQDGQLCMQVESSDGRTDSPLAGACGFENAPTKASYYYSSSPGPTPASNVSFSPLPTNAVGIRVATNEVVPAHPIPPRSGLPHGRVWILFCSRTCVTPPGSPLNSFQPLDANGNVIAFQRF